MLFALDICVNKKAPPTHSVHWGLNLTSETSTRSFFAKPHFSAIHRPPPTPNILVFQAPA